MSLPIFANPAQRGVLSVETVSKNSILTCWMPSKSDIKEQL